MIPTKAYILKIDTPLSTTYAKVCSDSCSKVGMPWTYYDGFQNQTGKMAFKKLNLEGVPHEDYKFIEKPTNPQKAMCASAGHYGIWKAISEGPDEAVVILEHDAIMVQPITIPIPDNQIVVLGYKLTDPSKYNHVKAGTPKDLVVIQGHEGAHAYAITRNTAKYLLEELKKQGVRSAVDNDYFIMKQRRTSVPICIMSPTPAVGWLRESTIWGKSAAKNYPFIPSFQENYK